MINNSFISTQVIREKISQDETKITNLNEILISYYNTQLKTKLHMLDII